MFDEKQWRIKNRYILARKQKMHRSKPEIKEQIKKRSKIYRDNHQIEIKQRRKQNKIKIKIILKELKTNGCSICGYNNNHSVLEFHHVNPNDKKFQIAHGIRNHTNERVAEELNKCILMCANCHKEIEFKEE